MAPIKDKQVLKISLVRIEDVVVRIAVHQYALGQTVGKADSMPHLVDGDIRSLTTGELTVEVDVATRGESTRLDRIEVAIT